jgi:hypothetical protein
LPEAIDQILNHPTSECASDLWNIVAGYKQAVSLSHLAQPCPQNLSLLKANALRIIKTAPGISTGAPTTKSQKYLLDLRDKHEDGKKVKMVVSMAKSVPKKGGQTKFEVVRSFCPYPSPPRFYSLFYRSPRFVLLTFPTMVNS